MSLCFVDCFLFLFASAELPSELVPHPMSLQLTVTSWRSWRHIQQAGGQRTLKTVKKVYIWHTRALPRYCSLQYLPPWRRDVSNRLPAPVSVPRRTWRQIAQSGRQSICKITKVTLYSQSALKHAKLCVFVCYYLPRKHRDVTNM